MEDAMYRNILLAAAFQNWEHYSTHALAARDVAATLARHAERLHVLTVYEHEATRIPAGVPTEMAAKLREQQTGGVDRMVAEKMDDYVGPLLSQGLPVAKILRLGSSPRHLIIEVAQEVDADLLVIGSHSKRGLLDIALGGTARHLSEHAPCPVVMVAPGAKK
jgi:nucleotide-binding universal stress UspA family protein